MSPRPIRPEFVWLPLVVAALLVIYMPGLGNALVFDDTYLTDSDGLFFEYASPGEWRTRMLSYGSFVWAQALLGEGWWKQRLINLALHIGVVAALWAFYREILRHIAPPAPEPGAEPARPYDESAALPFAIAFFALNPVAVYAVAYLIQRSILVATLFVVLGLWLFARGLARKRPVFHAAAVLCYALSLLGKEHAILAPLAALPVYILVARPPMARLLRVTGIGLALSTAAALLLYLAYGDILGKPFDEYSQVYLDQLSRLAPDAGRHAFLLSIVNESYLFFHYGLRWFLPFDGWLSINMRPPFPLSPLSFPHALGIAGYAGVLAGGFWLLVRYRDWRALVGLSLTLPALLFATEFATVWVQDPFVLYRSYLWAIGVPGLVFFVVHGPSGRIVAAIGVAVGVVLVWQAFDRVASLATPESAWSDAIRKLPDDKRSVGRWFPYLNRGSHYVESGQMQLAMRDFESSAALGDMGMGLFNMGSLLGAAGKHRQALEAFDRAEREGYRLYNLPFQRGVALLALGRRAEAYEQFEAARRRDPPSPLREALLLNLGRTALELGKRDEAIAALDRLTVVEPGNREARFLASMAHIAKGNHARAYEILDKLIADEPSGRVRYARALANYGMNRKAQALADIDAAIRMDPDNPNLLQWREKIRAMP